VLTSRRGAQAPGAAEAVASLGALGTLVTVAHADVADANAMAEVFKDIDNRLPPLSAVFHVAGIGDMLPIRQLDPARLEQVLAPKALGTLVLDALTRDRPLDAFVCFSSIASVWGAGGQAHYAAANAFLDAWVQARRTQGAAAFSINWGVWRGGGMATPEFIEVLDRFGVRSMAPEAALHALGRVLDGDRGQLVVADVDWRRFRSILEARGPRPLLADLPIAGESAANSLEAPLLKELRAAAADARPRIIRPWLQGVVAQLFRFSEPAQLDPTANFFHLGLDSLMALELRNRLQMEFKCALPVAIIFQHPSVDALVGHLCREAFPDGEAAAAVPTEPADREAGRWLIVPRPRPDARMRLICFSWAGGAASTFAPWPDDLPPDIELCAIQLPGRAERLAEPPVAGMEELVSALVPTLVPYLDRPFSMFGHCFGAIVMFEVARELRLRHGLRPMHLFPSGAAPPGLYALPNVVAKQDRLIDLLRFIQFTDERVLASEEMAGLLLPSVASDFGLAMRYRYRPSPPVPRDVPITAFAARDDFFAPPRSVERWREETTAEFSAIVSSGGHYFIVPERQAILRVIATETAYDLATLAHRSPAGGVAARWLSTPRSRPDASVTLFCFPGIGADASLYERWPAELPEAVELCAIEMPGKGRRRAELPLAHTELIIDLLMEALRPRLYRPFAFFGHDFGSIIHFELARRLRREGLPVPFHLFVSAAAAPQALYFAPIQQFAAESSISALGLMDFPLDIRDEAVRNMLRADFGAVWHYNCGPEPPLDIPITTFLGDLDNFAPYESVRGWEEQTTAAFTHHPYPGDHHTLWKDPSFLLRVIGAEVLGAIEMLHARPEERHGRA
jgi:surfactin synthase thioesterase subunit/aryl carrier-like protein